MARLNMMPVFTDAFLADTVHLSTEQIGAYWLLLLAMWRSGGELRAKPELLQRITKVGNARWPKTWEVLGDLFEISEDGSKIRQKKLSLIFENEIKKSDAARINGSKGGRPKSLENNTTGKATGLDQVPSRESRAEADQKLPYSVKKESKQASLSEFDAARDPPDPLRAGWLRAEVSKAFDAVGSTTLPDTSRCEVWLRQGRDPELCAAVVREQLSRRPEIRSLAYFDGPIRDAHAGRDAAAAVPDSGASLEARFRAVIDAWKRGWWMVQWEDFCGGPPDSPRCTIPAALLEECGANVAASSH